MVILGSLDFFLMTIDINALWNYFGLQRFLSRRDIITIKKPIDWWALVIASGVFLFCLSLLCLIVGNIYLGMTDTEFAKHDDSMYATMETVRFFWWAYLGLVLGVVLFFFGRWRHG